MKKFLTFLGILLFSSFSLQAQVTTIVSENFNPNFNQSSGFTISNIPGATWEIDQSHFVSAPSAIVGKVPNTNGDSIVLTTPTYDFTNYSNVHLSFKHICKISPSDIARIEYKEGGVGSSWTPIPASSYLGSSYYSENGFNAASYPFWGGFDSLMTPQFWWWKYEAFDLSNEISFSEAQFRFIIRKGDVIGSQINYGWLIDDLVIHADTQAITPPTVAFLPPLFQDTAYLTGPFVIKAKVKSNSTASLITPSLNYTATYNGTTTSGSVAMTAVAGDSTWQGVIPAFTYGSMVEYSITGIDSFGYYNKVNQFFYIKRGQTIDLVCLGDSTQNVANVEHVPFFPLHSYGWSKTLYFASELSPSNAGGTITNIAYFTKNDNRTDSISIYMKGTSSSTLINDYVDPIADGATLVWSGTFINPGDGTWSDILLQNSFDLPANQNLLVYVINKNGAGVGGLSGRFAWFAIDGKTTDYAVYQSQDKLFPEGRGSNTFRPITRFYITRFLPDSNSVAMQEIVSPVQGNFTAGTNTPISVIIKNRGMENLSSCRIGYSINGVFQKDTLWTGNLIEDFSDTVTLGSFIPTVNGYDTIVVWVNTPNGLFDSLYTDDTLQSIVYGCSGFLSGTYNVGPNGEFATLTDALTTLSLCGQGGDIVFALESGTYSEYWDLSDINSNYKITIQSAAMHHDSVILQSNIEDYAVLLKNTTNITISHITIDAVPNNTRKGILFRGSASDINISYCKILMNPTIAVNQNAHAAIYKENTKTEVLDNCRINNNIIDGGFYGIQLYIVESTIYNTGVRGKVTIDSNIITNAANYGLYISYGLIDIHANTILSRTSNTYSMWYGIYSVRTSGSITCNKIKTRALHSTAYGIGTQNVGDTANLFSFINNEITVEGSSTLYGLYISNDAFVNILHNSVHCTGNGNTRALQISVSSATSNKGAIKNNIFVAIGSNAFPIYCTSTNGIANIVVDNNCYYSPNYIGYAGGNKLNMEAWRATVKTDLHSININPPFIDITDNLKLSDYTGFECPVTDITSDIEGNLRALTTPMGAYSKELLDNDGSLLEILGWNGDSLAGTSTTIKAVVGNVGKKTITSMSLDWKFNGVAQNTINYNGNIATGQIDTITLGTITYSPLYNNLSVYISSLNNGIDEVNSNDTLSLSDCFCPGALSGTITVGHNSTFPSITEALNILNKCGASGSITLALEDGQYVENITLTPINGMIDDNTLGIYDTLTITSLSGNRDNVWIFNSTDASTNIGTFNIQMNNVVFKDISITSQSLTAISYSYSHCILFKDSNCRNIEFNNCWLRGVNHSTTFNTHAHSALCNTNRTIDNLRIYDCHLSGGSHAIYFASNGQSKDVVINNSLFDSTDNYGVYFSNTSFNSFNNNTISQRISNIVTPINYIGIYMTNCNGDITNNRIKSIKTNAGIYLTNFNTSKNGIVANNEIYAVNGNGIYLSNSKGQILHNSILCSGNTATKALYVDNGNTLTIKNNNLVTKSAVADYPIYISTANNVSRLTIDYNNYYSQRNTYVGYVGANITSMSSLQAATGQDSNSVIINPMFQNESINLMIMDNNGLDCPTLQDVTLDKNGVSRGTQTIMGAYHFEQSNIDAALSEIVTPDNTFTNTPIDVKVRLYNAGTTTLTEVTINWMINGVLQSPYTWAGNLGTRATSADITIGNFTPTQGNNEIVAFIVNTNNTTDQVSSNDTAYASIYGCITSSTNTYTIGQSSNADFKTPEEALAALAICGINSPIRLEIETGSHFNEMVLSQSIPGASTTNTITFTSQSGNATDVVWTNTAMGNINHLVFSKMTFEGVSNKYYNIRITASCDNIEFSDCILYGDTNSENVTDATMPGISALYHPKGQGQLTNFRMYRNYIYGGNYTLLFNGLVNNNDDITLEDNIIAGGSSSSVYVRNTDLKMKNNTISNRVSATNNEYRAINSDTSNLNIINNTINIESSVKLTLYAMYCYGSNNYIRYCNIEDNTINLNVTTATNTYGIYTTYNHANIKNNTVVFNSESKSFYGLYHNNALSLNVENNVVDVVSSNNTETFYGIYAVTCKNYNVINGNKIWMSDTTLQGRAILLNNFGTDALEMSLVTNNELSLIFTPQRANNDVCGIGLMSANAAILHNSIRITGGSQYETHGIYESGTASSTGYLVIKNNNIDMNSNADYPIFITNSQNIGTGRGQIDIDYNNFYAPQYVALMLGTKYTSIADWQSSVDTDKNSVRIQQQYLNATQSLEVSNKNDYQCPAPQQLTTDILGLPRYGTTIMGAYAATLPSIDLALINVDCPTISYINDVVTPAIIIKNTGTSAINSATINWAYNNVTQSPITWTGNLASLDVDTILLNSITLSTAGDNNIKAWISLVNGANSDAAIENDTIEIAITTCQAFSGTYTVGSTGDFLSIDEVVHSLKSCGITGNVTFEFLPEVHYGNLLLTEPINGSNTYTISFTKANRNSSTPAILQPTFGDAIVLKNQKNISFDSLTIKVDNGTAIKFIGAGIMDTCSNIAITNCIIYAKKITNQNTENQYRGIDKQSNTGIIDNLLIRNCCIYNGYYGIYIYAGSTSSPISRKVTIDSNIIADSHASGLYLYYANGGAIDNNIVRANSQCFENWSGIQVQYTSSHIRNNKIYCMERTLGTGYGIYTYQYNPSGNNNNNNMYISNNEIILKSSGNNRGMYIQQPRNTMILHNSIYLLSTGNAVGLGLTAVAASINNVVHNNNIVVTSNHTNATALEISAQTYIQPTYYKFDYNNYYAESSNILKIGTVFQQTIAALQALASTQNANSISIYPNFVDTSINLKLSNSLGLICPRNATITKDIEGTQREAMTIMGAYTMHVYDGIDLQLTEIVEPINNTNNLCSPSYTSVKYAITNVGGKDIDFSQNPITLTIRTTGANNAVIDTIISSGTLRILETEIFEVTNSLFVDYIGSYYLEASLSCAADSLHENDTIFSVYNTKKINLPFDEEFSDATLDELTIENLVGSDQWTVVTGNNNGYIDPFFGIGKLAFTGSKGSISRLSTGQIELNRTAQPVLEFWYAHDTSHANMNDQLSVTVTFDGGITHHTLIALNRYSNSISAPTWSKYFIDLSPYVDSSCAIIVFDAISYGGTQYIDRIAISSNTNIALTDALAIDVNACSLNNRTLSIEMTNQTGQAVDFSTDRTSIVVEISGATNQTLTLPLSNGSIDGLAVDTFAITNDFNFSPGTYNIKAYISPAVDKTLTDDTIYTSIIINPNLTITPKQVTGGTSMNNCLSIGTKVYQEVNIANNGNLNMDNIELTLNIYNISGVVIETINESITGTLAAGEDTNYSFLKAYTVPEDESFNVEIIVNPSCNTTLSYSNNIVECVDLVNVGISKFIEPANSNECSKINSQQKITVTVINETPNQDMRNISINAIIYANNQAVTTLKETIDNINASDSIDFTFSQSFVVPQANNYTIKVYIDKIDDTNDNDTLYITKCTDLGISESKVNSIGMSQNMPNPANDMAKVNYTIPNQGKVIFTIASVTGQILHTQEIEAKAGANSIEFNTANFADGIYFYTMDFNGHRLTKKMTIKK